MQRRFRLISSWLFLSTVIAPLVFILSCQFVEKPRPYQELEFKGHDRWIKEVRSELADGQILIVLLGGTSDQIENPVHFNLQVELERISRSCNVRNSPEKITATFSGLPMQISEISKLETGTGYSLRFQVTLPDDLMAEPSKIKNTINIVLDGFLECEGKPLFLEPINGRIKGYDSWIKRASVGGSKR